MQYCLPVAIVHNAANDRPYYQNDERGIEFHVPDPLTHIVSEQIRQPKYDAYDECGAD